jgi:hypothetical protein
MPSASFQPFSEERSKTPYYQPSKVALPGDKRELASPNDQNPTAIQSSDSAVLAKVAIVRVLT